MSAWVIALGLSAGYLINKNLKMTERLEQQVKVVNEQSKPSTSGLESEEIRDVQRKVPDADKYADMNIQDLSRERVALLTSARESAHAQAVEFERGPPPIEGVWLNLSDRGF